VPLGGRVLLAAGPPGGGTVLSMARRGSALDPEVAQFREMWADELGGAALYRALADHADEHRRPIFLALAEAEERARKENGLSSRELKAIDQMVREIIGKRVHAGGLFREDTLQRLEEMKAKLPPERRHDAEESIAQLKREQDEFSRLSEERKKYGDENVDAILARESELTECWKEAMALFAPTSGK